MGNECITRFNDSVDWFINRFRDHDRRADIVDAVRIPLQQLNGFQRDVLESKLSGFLPAGYGVPLLLPRSCRRAS